MNIAEILRKLADVVDGAEPGEDRPTNSVQHAELAPVEVDNTDNTETTTFVAPLQAKIELLKKATGVESHFDSAEGQQPDELDIIKQNAGIPVVAVAELSDDEPTEG